MLSPACSRRLPSRLLTLLLFAGCGGGGSDRETPSAEADAPAESAPPAESVAAAPAPVTIEDIARWEKGMAAELTAVREAGTKLKNAKTGDDTLAAMMGVQEMSTVTSGAKAAGLDEERYKAVRSDLGAAVGYLTPQLGGIDTTMLSQAQRDELRRMNAEQLKQLEGRVPAPVVEALKPKAETLRKREIELAGARLKSAGM